MKEDTFTGTKGLWCHAALQKSALTGLVYRHNYRSVLQLYCLPLIKRGGGTDGAQHHPQGGPHNWAVIESQVVAKIPGQVVPKTAMEHDLENLQDTNMYFCEQILTLCVLPWLFFFLITSSCPWSWLDTPCALSLTITSLLTSSLM